MRYKRANGNDSYDWSEEKVALLKELWPTHSARQIARRLGGFAGYAQDGRCAVVGKANRLGLPSKDSTAAAISAQARRASDIRWTKRPSLTQPWKPGDPKPSPSS